METFALITGASGAIGGALAERFAAEGYSLYLHYNRNEESALALQKRLLEAYPGRTVKRVHADFSNPDHVPRFLEQVDHSFEVIVHNSGASYIGLLTDMDDDVVRDMVELHVTSPLLVTKALLPDMISRKRGSIIVVSSVWGLTGASTEVVYSTVKGALNAFVKSLAKEVAPSGISVNGIAPGAIATKMLDHLSQHDKEALREDIPAGRFGRPEEIADLAVFLSSRKAAYINGDIISMNGAWY